jgi:hypothetical protein
MRKWILFKKTSRENIHAKELPSDGKANQSQVVGTWVVLNIFPRFRENIPKDFSELP